MIEAQEMIRAEVDRAFHDGSVYRLSHLAVQQIANRADVWDWLEEVANEVDAEIYLSRLGTTFVMVPR